MPKWVKNWQDGKQGNGRRPTQHSFRTTWTFVEIVVFHLTHFQEYLRRGCQTWLIVLVRSKIWNVITAEHQHQHRCSHADCRVPSTASRRKCKAIVGYSRFFDIRWVFQVPAEERVLYLEDLAAFAQAAQARYPPLLEDVQMIARPTMEAKEEAPNNNSGTLGSLAETISWFLTATWHLEPNRYVIRFCAGANFAVYRIFCSM